MLYWAYQTHDEFMAPLRSMARTALASVEGPNVRISAALMPRNLTAAWEMVGRTGLTHTRPSYEIDSVTVGNREVAVTEEAACVTPFATLLPFRKDVEAALPPVLVVAPLSGHFATLLRNTVKTLLPDHDVYITDWHNARDVHLADGGFGFDDYVDHIIKFLRAIGPGAHGSPYASPASSFSPRSR